MSQYRVAVLGADSLVGEALLEQLVERRFPAREIRAFSFGCTIGSQVSAGGEDWDLEELNGADLQDFDLLLAAPRCGLSLTDRQALAQGKTLLVDAGDDTVDASLIAFDANAAQLADVQRPARIALPSSLAVALATVLKPLRPLGLRRVQVSSYQAVSDAGRDAVEELVQQTRQLLTFQPISSRVFPRQIAFNCLPLIGEVDAEGQGSEERRVTRELRVLLDEPALPLSMTAVQVPVFYGHGAALTVELAEGFELDALRARLSEAPGLRWADADQPGYYPTAVTDASGEEVVCLGRLRRDPSLSQAIQIWLVADNLRQGCALNAVRIAEALLPV